MQANGFEVSRVICRIAPSETVSSSARYCSPAELLKVSLRNAQLARFDILVGTPNLLSIVNASADFLKIELPAGQIKGPISFEDL
jgi:hypothetical protein